MEFRKTWRHGHGDMETRKHEDIGIESWKHREIWTWGNGEMETWTWRQGHGDIKQKTGNGHPGNFSYSVYRLLVVKTEVCRLSVNWLRNKRKLSICKRTRRTCPSMDRPWSVCSFVIPLKHHMENLAVSPFKKTYQLIPLSAKFISLDSPFKNNKLSKEKL